MRFTLCAALVAALICAAPLRAQTPPHPGIGISSDLAFLTLAFADDDASRLRMQAWRSWSLARTQEDHAARTASLRALVPTAKPLDLECFDNELCVALGVAMNLKEKLKTRAAFDAAHAEAQGLLDLIDHTYSNFNDTKGMTLLDRIVHLTARDQILRGLSVYAGNKASLAISDNARQLVLGYLMIWMTKSDADGRAALEELWRTEGWPLKSKVGEAAATAAFLIVQHSGDLAFQLRALAQLEQHLADGEVSAQQYPLVYDRVYLQTVGTQSYGSQLMCKDKKWVVSPLDAPEAEVDARRKAFGLGTVQQNYNSIVGRRSPDC